MNKVTHVLSLQPKPCWQLLIVPINEKKDLYHSGKNYSFLRLVIRNWSEQYDPWQVVSTSCCSCNIHSGIIVYAVVVGSAWQGPSAALMTNSHTYWDWGCVYRPRSYTANINYRLDFKTTLDSTLYHATHTSSHCQKHLKANLIDDATSDVTRKP